MEPSIEERIAHLKQLTRNKETLTQAYEKLMPIEILLEREREALVKKGIYHSHMIYRVHIVHEATIDLQFLAHEDIEAVLKVMALMEQLDGVAYELYRKQLFWWRKVKEFYPDCGTLYAHGFDRDRRGYTNESKAFRNLRKRAMER